MPLPSPAGPGISRDIESQGQMPDTFKKNIIRLVFIGTCLNILFYFLPSFALIRYALFLGKGESVYSSISNLVFLPLSCFSSGMIAGRLAGKKYGIHGRHLFLVAPGLYLFILTLMMAFLYEFNINEFFGVFRMIRGWFAFCYFSSLLGVLIGEKSSWMKFFSGLK